MRKDYRVRNRLSKNFVSRPTTSTEAYKYQKLLNESSSNPDMYEVVNIEAELEKLSIKPRLMSDDEKDAVKALHNIRYSPGAGHSEFASGMIVKVDNKDFEITEKQAAYLWFIIYHYRKQIADRGLVALAQRNKIY